MVSREPSIYLRGKILTHTHKGDGRASLSSMEDTFREAGLTKQERRITNTIRRLLAKLTELSVSFRLRGLNLEQDDEVPDWNYVIVEVELHIPEVLFPYLEDHLLDFTYSQLSPSEATKLLLIFHHV